MIDMETGEFIHDSGNSTGFDTDGHFHMRFGRNMSLDTETGETHITSGWKNDDDSSFFGKLSSLFDGDEEE